MIKKLLFSLLILALTSMIYKAYIVDKHTFISFSGVNYLIPDEYIFSKGMVGNINGNLDDISFMFSLVFSYSRLDSELMPRQKKHSELYPNFRLELYNANAVKQYKYSAEVSELKEVLSSEKVQVYNIDNFTKIKKEGEFYWYYFDADENNIIQCYSLLPDKGLSRCSYSFKYDDFWIHMSFSEADVNILLDTVSLLKSKLVSWEVVNDDK